MIDNFIFVVSWNSFSLNTFHLMFQSCFIEATCSRIEKQIEESAGGIGELET